MTRTMARYGMVIDVSRCIGCYNCFLACRDEHAGNDHRPITLAQPAAGHRWINIREQERGSFPKVKVSHIPVLCLQCADAPCIGAATNGAVYRREDGIVLIDPDKVQISVDRGAHVSTLAVDIEIPNTVPLMYQKAI